MSTKLTNIYYDLLYTVGGSMPLAEKDKVEGAKYQALRDFAQDETRDWSRERLVAEIASLRRSIKRHKELRRECNNPMLF